MISFNSHIFRRYLVSLLLLLSAVGCRYGVAPRVLSLPDDFSYSAQVVSKDNFYDELAEGFKGEVQSNTKFSYDVIGREGNVMLIRNAFDVRSREGERIFSVERQYGIDRISGDHVAGYGDRDREGYLFAPHFLDKQDVTYWHVNYDTPVLLRFQGEDVLEGLSVYRYESTFHADQTENLKHLPFVGTARGVNLDIHLQVWFEPVSGRMVKYADQATAYFYDLSTGKRLSPWNRFSNTFSEKSIEEQVQIAKDEKMKGELWSLYIPLLLLLLALLWAAWTLFQTTKWRPTIDRRAFVIGGLVFVSLGTTLARWAYLSMDIQTKLESRFKQDTTFFSELVTDRMKAQVALLEGAQGLIDAIGKPINASEWRSYVDALNLTDRYPGLQGIGFASLVTPRDKAAFQARMKEEITPTYEIIPSGNRSEYVPVAYLEPADERNRRAIGYDMFSEAVRREAMVAARDYGTPALSGKVTLVQETDPQTAQAGVLLYVPVYRHGAKLDTIAERRDALLGYVYSPFRMDNLINALTAGRDMGVDMEIYDGTEENAANPMQRLFSSLPRTRRTALPLLTSTQTLPIIGHPWTFRFSTMPGYGLGTLEERMPTVVLLSGLSFTVLMVLAMWMVCRWSRPDASARSSFVKRSPIKEVL